MDKMSRITYWQRAVGINAGIARVELNVHLARYYFGVIFRLRSRDGSVFSIKIYEVEFGNVTSALHSAFGDIISPATSSAI